MKEIKELQNLRDLAMRINVQASEAREGVGEYPTYRTDGIGVSVPVVHAELTRINKGREFVLWVTLVTGRHQIAFLEEIAL